MPFTNSYNKEADDVTPVQIAAGDDVVCYFGYQQQIEITVANYIQAENVAELKATYESTTWRVWQLRLIEELHKKPDPRKVIWYVDDVGNSGKTFLTKYLLTEGNCMRYENGKSADVKYAYQGQEIVCGFLDEICVRNESFQDAPCRHYGEFQPGPVEDEC